MKKNKLFIIVGLSLLTLITLFTGYSNVDAKFLGYYDFKPSDNIKVPVSVVYTKDKLTTIYNSKGEAYKSLSLAPKTAWATGIIVTHNTSKDNFDEYFQVSTDGYVKTSDITIVNPDGSSVLHTRNQELTPASSLAYYFNKTAESPEIALPKYTIWKIGEIKELVVDEPMMDLDPRNQEGPHWEYDKPYWTAKRITYLVQVASDSYVNLTGDRLGYDSAPIIQ